jgi:hypothetical protein
MQYDQRSGAYVPKEVKFEYPEQRVTLRMNLSTVAVNAPIDQSQARQWFTRPEMPNTRSVDLATAFRNSSYTGNAIRPAGGAFLRTPR